MKVGITGHQELENPLEWSWVKEEILRILILVQPPLVGVSSLAAGADQVFAQAVLDCRGRLEVIVPFSGYENTLQGNERSRFNHLLGQASFVEVLSTIGSKEQAYLQAGKFLVDHVKLLIAVWDGEPAAGLGGTGDIVEYARKKQIDSIHINPQSKTVSRLIHR